MSVSAIVMASGLSKRMGRDKLLMKLNGKHIFEFVFETISKCRECFNEIIVVAKEEVIITKAMEYGFKAVKNESSYIGQSESIKLGILNSFYAGGYMFFTADQPFISEETIKYIIDTFKKNSNNITVPCYNGIIGSPAIFPEIFKEQLLKLENDTGGKVIIKENWDKTIKVHIHSEIENIDIDTIEDYERVQTKKVII